MINHHFLDPKLLKPLKKWPGYQNLLGVLLKAHSDHQGPVSSQIYFKNDGLAFKNNGLAFK